MDGLAIAYPLRTERLELRQFEPDDFEALLGIYSRPEVTRFLYEEPLDATAVRRMLVSKVSPKPHALRLAGVVAETGELVGDFSLVRTRPEHHQGEIGYIIHPDHRARGYAGEGARAMLRLAFEDLALHRVIGRAQLGHDASARVLAKLGMRHEATFHDDEWVKGEWSSQVVYAMLAREWANRERLGARA